MMHVSVRQTGTTLRAETDCHSIFFEVSGIEHLSMSTNAFAVWLMLPLAMRSGRDLHIRGNVDSVVLENARDLARIWAMWLPDKYAAVDITADGTHAEPAVGRRGSILLYSGGVDSTYALLTHHQTSAITAALTVHGLDYNFDDEGPFQELIKKTDPLLSAHQVRRIVVRTDAGRKIGDLGLTHGFVLASCLFAVSREFEFGLLAADLTLEQEMMVFPWGTNHVTNRRFAGAEFRLETVSYETSRIQKLERILSDPVALNAVSFCGNKAVRPANCGTCPKCLRTKTMLIALTGSCPDIFLDNDLSPRLIARLEVASNASYKHYAEILRVARRRGFIDRLPGLERRVERALAARRRRKAFGKYLDEAARAIGLA